MALPADRAQPWLGYLPGGACVTLPGIQTKSTDSLKEAFVPKVTANGSKRQHLRCQLCFNSQLDQENGISGHPGLLMSPSWAWRTKGFPKI